MATSGQQEQSGLKVIGHYHVFTNRLLGSGTFGKVFVAEDLRSRKRVCAKQILHTDEGFDSEFTREQQQRNQDEVRCLILAKNHPNIVQCFDCITHDGDLWVFMESCALGDLFVFLNHRNQSLTTASVMKIMQHTASAVEFLHSQSPPIIHRDIKLKNILVDEVDERPVYKLADFGLAKLVPEGINLTEFYMGTAAGTLTFMAPEFFSCDEIRYDASVDVFSLGLVYKVLITYNGEKSFLQPCSGKSILV